MNLIQSQKHYIVIIILCLITNTSCSKKNILSEEETQAVLYDIYLTESMYDIKYSDFNSEDNKSALLNNVLKKHNITKAQLDSTLIWYSDNPEAFIRINDSVVSKFRQEIKQFDIKYAQIKNKNYKNKELGSLPSSFYLTDNEPLLRFNIDSIEITKYPNFQINVSTLGVNSEDSLVLSLTYNCKDTIIIQNQLLLSNNNFLFKIDSIQTSLGLKYVEGYFYVNPSKIKNRRIFLNGISLNNQVK